jgi:hypothetical protein
MYTCMHPYPLVFIFNLQVLRCTYAHALHVYTCNTQHLLDCTIVWLRPVIVAWLFYVPMFVKIP